MKISDERLKIWIDLLKWAVVSVGLVIMTTIIDSGFKDREVGINELKEYDKYVFLVVDNTKLAERRLLAQYFAYVTPSDKLKQGWKDYFAVLDEEYNTLQQQKEAEEQKLAESQSLQPQQRQMIEQKINEIDYELTPSFNKGTSLNDYNEAVKWERVGFENVLSRQLEEAIIAFENAETIYPGFHQVYEIRNYLSSIKDTRTERDDRFWQEINATLVREYGWKMPRDIAAELRSR